MMCHVMTTLGTGLRRVALFAIAASVASCEAPPEPADLLLVGGHLYTMDWPEPSASGEPALGAPDDEGGGWRSQADAIAVRDGRIVQIGTTLELQPRRGPGTEVIDLQGGTILPGLIDSHVHLAELGASLERVDLVGAGSEEDVVARVAARAALVPAGQWIEGWGWDEGAWADRYPDMARLSEAVPDHPVVLHGLHSFAVWGNRLALERAGITEATAAPAGGEIRKDAAGRPTGILTNNGTALLTGAVPPPGPERLETRLEGALETLAAAGYVAVHEAGADRALLAALETLDRADGLPLRVHVMLAARDTALVDEWLARGPRAAAPGSRLTVRSVKAFYDGAMGSRGAYFLDDYSDQPGHRGLGGADYGFDRDRMAAMMRAGFQVTIHAIGDRAVREALDFFETVMRESPAARETRPRIEHAQVVHADDLARFAALGVTASMQPSHAVEDMPWAEDRVGPERIDGAYAWRSIRRGGGRLVLNSDLPGTAYDFFYGLHSAVTRQDRDGAPAGGWRPEERLTIEEAVRGWTTWAAWTGFEESVAGILAPGRPADLTVVSIDPFTAGAGDASALLSGRILLTMAAGDVLFRDQD
jgi:hypothetical protein